jgi:hypothetical protein
MHIVSALFIDGVDTRSVPGPSTRLDLTGIQFSAPAPEPLPFTWAPHLCVIVHNPVGDPLNAVLEVRFFRDDEQMARSVQPLQVDPGKFSQRLVRAELDFVDYGTVQAHCRIDQGHEIVVPYTILEPLSD